MTARNLWPGRAMWSAAGALRRVRSGLTAASHTFPSDTETATRATAHNGVTNGNVGPRSQLLSLAPHGHEGGARDARLRRHLRSAAQDARRHRRGRPRFQIADLLPHRWHHTHAERR